MKNIFHKFTGQLLTAALFLTAVGASAGEAFAQKDSTYDEALYDTVKWRQVGPFRGGRAGTVVGNVNRPNEYIMGTAGGGVWKTSDGGNTWHNISDGYFGGSIGAVAMAPSDENVLYVGEGEQTLRGNVSSGNGLWKSTDGGNSWTHIGLKGTEHIARIRVHPTNPDIVYVAAIGNLWKPNTERGIYKTVDGGETWKKILYESDEAGGADLTFDPNNPRILYASTWQMKRNGYRMDSGGPGSKFWKSVDSGETWTDITRSPGLPEGTLGIIGMTVSPVNSDRVWVIIEANGGGLFRSDDAGKTWIKTSEDRNLMQRAWYYSRIYADPQLEDRIYVMNVDMWRSNDGGFSFESIDTPHGDHHDLWINPTNNEILGLADDGGAQISYNSGESWTTYHNQPTAQFYRVTTDNHFPFRILGAQQDNTAIRISHRSPGNAITERDWEPTAGGESAHLAPDPTNPDIVYGGTYKGYMNRLDHSNNQRRSTNVWPDNPAGSGAEVMKYRFNWNFPVTFSPNDPSVLYAGSNHLHKSTNGGQSWEVISPDLTRNDPETIRSSGGPITQDNTGAEFYANIFVITESDVEPGVIWTGSDDGLVHVTRDGGETWEEVTPKGSPRLNMMNSIDVHPTKKGHAYLAATHYKFGDYTPYLYKTTNYGKSWKLITDGIPENHYTRVLRADKSVDGLLYAGTEWGMYVSWDDGENWQPFQLNLPVTAIRDLHVRDNMLIAATHGRSFWMIDDLGPIQQLNKDVAGAGHHLFKPKASYRLAQGGGWGRFNKVLEGENHPNGVLFNYFIKDYDPEQKVELRLEEADGTLIRSFSNDAEDRRNRLKVSKGENRFVWDMRYEGFKEFDGMVLYASPNRGPRAVPGTYVAKLIVDGDVSEQSFDIVKDPRIPNTAEDFKRQFDYLISVRDKVSEAHQAIIDIRRLRADFDYYKNKFGDDAAFAPTLEAIEAFDRDMSVIENNIHMTKNQARQDPLNYGIRINNRLSFLMADQQRGDFIPTDQAVEFKAQVEAELDVELNALDQLISSRLDEINRLGNDLGVRVLSSRN